MSIIDNPESCAVLTGAKTALELQSELESSNAITEVIRRLLSDDPIEVLLRDVLSIILKVEWLSVLKKGSIHLYDKDNDILRMVAHVNLDEELVDRCHEIPLGHCLCGRAALLQEIVYKSTIDEDHRIHFDGMDQHGHYCLPIIHTKELLGVLNLYLVENHVESEREKKFLDCIVNTIAGLLIRKTEEYDKTKYEAIVRNSKSGIVFTCANWNVSCVNPAFLEMMDYSDEGEVLGKHFKEFHKGIKDYDEEFYAGMKATLEQVGFWDGEMKCRKKGGEFFIINMTITPIRDAHNKLTIYAWFFRDISYEKSYEKKLLELAFKDPLTSLLNRNAFEERLLQQVLTGKRNKQSHAILYISMDKFKKVNDEFGPSAGDAALKEVGTRIQDCVKKGTDTIARIEGDKFGVILAEIGDVNNVGRIVGRIISIIKIPFLHEGKSIHLSCSVGISIFPRDSADAGMLLKAADTALQRIKETSAGNYKFSSQEMVEESLRVTELERALKVALKKDDELFLLYQPKFCLLTGKFVGVEALIRWDRPGHGLVSPADFIPIAEETDLIIEIGWWVITKATRQGALWRKQGLPPINIAINLSTRQFNKDELVGRIKAALADTGLPAENFELEITETTAATNEKKTIRVMNEIIKIGVTFSLDDYGTGHASINYLRKFPVSTLKIDRSFLSGEVVDEALFEGIIAMSDALGLKTVAEGVETEEHMKWLRGIGCTLAQGYFCSRPVTPEQISELLAQGGKPMGCFLEEKV